MNRSNNARSVKILYIGRPDASYEKMWQSLVTDGIAVTFAATQTQGMQLARDLKPHIAVVNTANSHFSGVYLCRVLGRRLPGTQRLVLTERGEGEDIVCEQRLIRPFTTRRLREAIYRMVDAASPHVLRAGDIELDLVARVVNGPLGRHHLTPKQSDLLAIFLQRPNQVISRRELMEQIWKTDYLGDTRTLDVHIRWLREKFEAAPDHPQLLVTRRGVGYVLLAPVPELPPEDADESEN